MKPWQSWARASQGLTWYVMLVILLPLLTLSAAGLYWLWRESVLLVVVVSWLAVTLLAYLALVVAPSLWRGRRPPDEGGADPHRSAAADGDALPEQLPERSDWSARDRVVWQRSCQEIERVLDTEPAWGELTDLSLQTLSSVAEHYHAGKREVTYRFTLPEVLLVVSVASARYRSMVMSHLPYADRISIGTVVSLVRRQDQIRTGFTWVNRFRRTARLVNPLAAVVGELRDHFTDKVLGEVGSTLQRALKRLLLQEVAQAGIDLYSGRLKVSGRELAGFQSAAARADDHRHGDAPEPLRIVILGQVSTGKSSMVNALIASLKAETDRLPTTDRLTVHALQTDDGARFHLVDTPGIDADAERQQQLVDASLEADLLVWLVRATQPARALDRTLLERLDARFAALPDRRRPPMIVVMSHADGLSPKAQWDPPYDLGSDERKAANMRAALQSILTQLDLPADTPAIPACLSAERGRYNVEAIAVQLTMLADDALGTQFNRRRIERAGESSSGRDRWRQFVRLGYTLGRAVTRSS